METTKSFSDVNPFGSKIDTILNQKTDSSEDFFESLKVLSDIFNQNNLRTRRNLRSSIESKRLLVTDELLKDISTFKESLDELSSDLSSMLSRCSNINAKLQKSSSRMEKLVTRTNSNHAQKSTLSLMQIAADALLKSLYISPEELTSLTEIQSLVHTTRDHFLVLLRRAKHIQSLFITSIHLPSTPLSEDIIKTTTLYIDKAYKCLYDWVKKEVISQSFEAVEIPVFLRDCLQELKERPILFKYVLDEYANSRRTIVNEAFLNALIVGLSSASGPVEYASTKPIELQSHDPLRYAGDMLAWLHQVCASEREYLRSLTFDKVDAELLNDFLNSITNGLAHPLQFRLEQILVTEHNAVLLYKINNVLQFYSVVIMNLLTENAVLYKTLLELQTLCWTLFIGALKQQASGLLTGTDVPRHDLLLSSSDFEVIKLLEAILTCQDMSYSTPDVKQTKHEEIIKVIFEPLFERMESIALRFGDLSFKTSGIKSVNATNSHRLTIAARVYLINCLHIMHTSISRLEFTDAQITRIESRIEELLNSLTQEQVSHILTQTCLKGIHDALMREKSQPDLANISISNQDLQNAITRFNAFLASPDSLDLPELQSIAFPSPRNLIRRRSADQVHSIFTEIFTKASDPSSGFENIEIMKSPQQVAELILTTSD